MQNKKVAVLFSGGLDSSATLLKALEDNDRSQVELFFFDYLQNTHREEIEATEKIANKYGVAYTIHRLSGLDMFLDCSLTSGENDGGEPGYSSYVPNRNLLFLTLLSNLCIIKGFDTIYAGFQYQLGKTGERIKYRSIDAMLSNATEEYNKELFVETVHADQTSDFIFGAMNLIYLSSGGKVKLTAPLMRMDKVDILQYLADKGELKFITENSYTCYNPEGKMHEWGKGCGKCTSCENRKKAYAIYKHNYNGKI